MPSETTLYVLQVNVKGCWLTVVCQLTRKAAYNAMTNVLALRSIPRRRLRVAKFVMAKSNRKPTRNEARHCQSCKNPKQCHCTPANRT